VQVIHLEEWIFEAVDERGEATAVGGEADGLGGDGFGGIRGPLSALPVRGSKTQTPVATVAAASLRSGESIRPESSEVARPR
jgi:hypothetical protein